VAVSDVGPFIVIAFPASPDAKASSVVRQKVVADIAGRLIAGLSKACGERPHLLWPDTTAICMLVHGEFQAIKQAVDDAAAFDTRAFIARIEQPIECIELSAALTWARAHDLPT
jgi:hypothetical protein